MIIRKREETKPVKVDAEARADQEHKTRAGRDTEWEADEATAATPTATGDNPKNERATTMKETTKTSRLAGQLEKLYNKLNADFFNGELEPLDIIPFIRRGALKDRSGGKSTSQPGRWTDRLRT